MTLYLFKLKYLQNNFLNLYKIFFKKVKFNYTYFNYIKLKD